MTQYTYSALGALRKKFNAITGALVGIVNPVEDISLATITAAQQLAGATGTVSSSSTGGLVLPSGTAFNAGITAKSTTSLAGDSIFAYGWDSSQPDSIFIPQWASSQMPVGLDVLQNYAVGGTTSTDLITTQLGPMLADGCEIAWIHTGVNDLSATAATANSVATFLANAQTILTQLCAVKKAVIWDSINPITIAANDRALEIPYINEQVARIVRQFPNAIWNDTYDTLLDTASLTGDPVTNYLFDGAVHQNSWGAKLLGFRTARNLRGRLNVVPGYASTVFTFPDLSGTGGTKTAGGGSITGTVPTSMNVTVSSGTPAITTTSKVSTAGQRRFSAAIVAAAAGDLVYIQNTNTTSYPAANTGLVAGALIRAFTRIRVQGQTNLNRAGALININGTQFPLVDKYASTIETPTVKHPAEAYVKMIRTRPLALAANLANITIQLQFGFSAAGGATVDVYPEWGIELLTRL